MSESQNIRCRLRGESLGGTGERPRLKQLLPSPHETAETKHAVIETVYHLKTVKSRFLFAPSIG